MFVKTVNLYIITLWITLFFSLIFVCHFSWDCSILEIRACEVHQTGFRACINLAFSVADIDFVDEEKMAHDLIFCQAPSLRRSIDLLFERNMTFFPYFFLTVELMEKKKFSTSISSSFLTSPNNSDLFHEETMKSTLQVSSQPLCLDLIS